MSIASGASRHSQGKHALLLRVMEGARGRRRRRRTSREPEPSVLRISQSPLRVCTGTSAWICLYRVHLDIFPLPVRNHDRVDRSIQDDDGDTRRGRGRLTGW